MTRLVTKEYLIKELSIRPIEVIGRALVTIFKNQTQEERNDNATKFHNGIGFTGTDGRIGAITAKYYIKHGTLLDWQIRNWMLPNRKGVARIVKYANQLDRIAKQRLHFQPA